VGAKSLATGIWGAYKNVLINMADIEDETFKQATLALAETINTRARETSEKIFKILADRA
jgi:glutamate formiminotransferase/formiminotetrahydrofolate cyclodeaminase